MATAPLSERCISQVIVERNPTRRRGSLPELKTLHNELGIIADPHGPTVELLVANRELNGQRSGLVFRCALPEQ